MAKSIIGKAAGLGVGAIACAVAATALLPRAEAAKASVGEITFLSGKAERAPGKGEWTALKAGAKVFQGDRLKTADDGRLEAKLSDGSMLRLGQASELALDNVSVKKNQPRQKVQARLVFGRIWAKVTSFFGQDDTSFEVTTPNAVAGVRGTSFSAAYDQSGSTTVKVYEGKVLVSNKPIYAVKGHTKENRVQVAGPQEISKNQWEELVAGAMQMIQVAQNGDMAAPQEFAMADPAKDDWESWNAERDKLAAK